MPLRLCPPVMRADVTLRQRWGDAVRVVSDPAMEFAFPERGESVRSTFITAPWCGRKAAAHSRAACAH